jgi:redox-sensitive bicupin YhaK (pirin superfamily)
MSTKAVELVVSPSAPHFVGDGFRVHNFVPSAYKLDMKRMDPIIMLDYNSKYTFEPSIEPKGVGVHPHRGFETVTIAYKGQIEHHDSSGGGGVISEGDVQWMTAASGVLHKEFHEEEFSRRGGVLHGAQLWVNLPAQYKNTPPSYQDLKKEAIPEIVLPDQKGTIRILAGALKGLQGIARTFTRINIYDIHAQADAVIDFELPPGDNCALLLLKGTILVDDQVSREGDLVVLDQQSDRVKFQTNNTVHVLVLSGEPILEPVVAYGPFVMNTQEEIIEAIDAFQAGKFGKL